MDRTDQFARCPRAPGYALRLCALLLCGWVLAGCQNAVPDVVPDDKTYVNVQVSGRAAEMTMLTIAATLALAGGQSLAFDQMDKIDPNYNRLILVFPRDLRGMLTVNVSASGAACSIATGSATVMLAGQPEVDVTVNLSPAAVLSAIAASATYSTMATGYQQKFMATGTFADGSTKDLSGLVKWSSTNPAVAAIDATGLVTGAVPGMTSISAALSCQTGSTDLSVLARTAQFNQPAGVAVDGNGIIYVADSGNKTIRKITPVGVVSTFVGTNAGFGQPYGLVLDGAGNLNVADFSANNIRKVTPAGVVTTLVGAEAMLSGPELMAVDKSGNLYVPDYGDHTIRKSTPGGVVTTLAGTAGTPGTTDGIGPAARFNGPSGVAVDGSGNVYVTDFNNDTIRKITPDGTVSTLAGSPLVPAEVDGTGTAARFVQPLGIVVDGSGNLFVTDYGGSQIRKITPDGSVTTPCAASQFNGPGGVALDGAGNLIVVEHIGHTIRKITLPDCVVTTLAGTGVVGSQN